MAGVGWWLVALVGCGPDTPTWDVDIACTLQADGEARVTLQVSAPGCQDLPLGALTLGPDDAGTHVLVASDDALLPALRACAAESEHLMLWVQPGGRSGCGHRLPIDTLPGHAGLAVELARPLELAAEEGTVAARGALRVEAR